MSDPIPSIRLATIDDAATMLSIYAPFVIDTAVSFETEPPSIDVFKKRIEETLQRYPWLVYETGSEFGGFAYACQHRTRAAYGWGVDSAVYVAETFRRRGVGRALYSSLLALLRAQGYFRAFAGITLPNEPSVALHESLGFAPIGVYRNVGFKLGRWHDVGWWGAQIQEPHTDPGPPTPIVDAKRAPEWITAMGSGLSNTR